jgi:hypothetical protein
MDGEAAMIKIDSNERLAWFAVAMFLIGVAFGAIMFR